MASRFTDDGIDAILAVFPQGGAPYATLMLGLFTSATETTVPSGASFTEASGATYERQPVAAAAWGAPAAADGGRRVEASPVAFPTAGTGGWGRANGFFLATAGGTIIYFANFDDGQGVTIGAGDRITITPSMTFRTVV